MNDLNVHKLTPLELKRNHELHQPKKDHERLLRKIESARVAMNSFNTTGVGSSFYAAESPFRTKKSSLGTGALTKQKLCEQEREMHDLLLQTDKTINEMDDIMGNITHKYRSFPVLTQAPRLNKDITVNEVSVLNPGDHLYYDNLRESIVRTRSPSLSSHEDEDVFEDEEEEEEEHNEEGEGETSAEVTGCTFEGKVDIDRYQNLLRADDDNDDDRCESKMDKVPDVENMTQELAQLLNEKDDTSCDINSLPISKDENSHSAAAVAKSKTKKVKVTKSKSNNGTTSRAKSSHTLTDMEEILSHLDEEIKQYELETGKERDEIRLPKFQVPSSVSGYTANLLSMLLRLTHHLRESEVQLKVPTHLLWNTHIHTHTITDTQTERQSHSHTHSHRHTLTQS